MVANQLKDVATLAISISETFRPLFLRWASDEAREVFEHAMDALWLALEGRACDCDSLLRQIEALPEFEYDDSDHRDFFVMIALTPLHQAVEVVRGTDSEEKLETVVRELNAATDHLARELQIGGLRTDLRGEIQGPEGPVTTEKARAIAMQLSARVDSALTTAARRRGWPPDRLRRP
jgi:hypothetical protein